MKPLWQTVERGAVQVEVGEAQEAHVGVEQDVQREEAETVEHGCCSGRNRDHDLLKNPIPQKYSAMHPAALYTWPSTC